MNINWCAWLPWMLLGAALLGGLIGWYLNRRRWQGRIESLEKRDGELNAALNASHEENNSLNGVNVQLTSDLKDVEASLNVANKEKLALSNTNGELNAEIKELKAALKTANGSLKACNVKVEDHQGKIGELEAENNRLNKELLLLQQELEELSASASTRGIGGDMPMSAGAPMIDQDEILAEIKGNAGQIPVGSLGVGLESQRDNLLKIKNITPWQEAKLNAAGINSYLQIARMQDEEAGIVAGVAQLDAETIKKDDWKGQARALLAAIAAAAPKDNLKKIEGIGPKIEQLCFNNGIYTFHDLARTSVSVLKHILKEGGSRFRMHNPGTWPKQAELAALGDWEALKKWQDELDGGV